MSNIKVRFAPSPTGFMHIGNTRTALFNWLWAKKLGGKFMLRIDDTDKLRSKKEYEDVIRDNLCWLGLTWSEEARQSARFDRYNEVTDKLKAAGRIYACYETPEELEFKRKRSMAKGLPPIYDRQALNYTAEDIARFEAEGRRPHYRFKLLDGEIRWNDMVRGEVKYEAANLSDPIIIREDGSFLYHLPSVIDDADFGICGGNGCGLSGCIPHLRQRLFSLLRLNARDLLGLQHKRSGVDVALVLLCKKILLTSDLKCQQRGVICLLLFPHFRICGGKSLFSGLKCGLSIPLCLPAGRGVLFCGFKL